MIQTRRYFGMTDLAYGLVVSEGNTLALIISVLPRAMVFIAEGNKKATRYNANAQ